MARHRGRRQRNAGRASSASSTLSPVSDPVTVEVVAGLTGAAVCQVQARDVLELKVAIEEASGIHRLDQRLTLGAEVLEDSRQLAADASGSLALVVRLVNVATVASATRRALRRLTQTGDAKSNTVALDKELADVPLLGVKELDEAISAVLQQAISDPDSSVGCADVALSLRTRYPKAPSDTNLMLTPTFALSIFRMCEAEFRVFPEPLESAGAEMRQRTQARELAMMRFTGAAFSRGLLPVMFFGGIVSQFCQVPLPKEHHTACICELLLRLGPAMDALEHGRRLVTQLVSKIAILEEPTDPDSGLALYSEGLNAQMRGLIALRECNWSPPQNGA